MTRSELIDQIVQRNPSLDATLVERIVIGIFDEIKDTLAAGGRVELRGFGSFFTKSRRPRVGRNPRTGETISVEPKVAPGFKAGKNLRLRMNQS
jgi:integration host factor subunit beta